jgi:hypothetical protein
MPVVVPPPSLRRRFALLGQRLPPVYRPWVFTQITAPGYQARRTYWLLLIQVLFVVLPQTLIAVAAHSVARAVLPLAVLLLFALLAAWTRFRPSEAQQRRLLAYHGLTADGRLVEPVSPWSENPLGKSGLAVLTAQLVVFASGVTVAADRVVKEHDCKPVPASSLAALTKVMGVPRPGPPGRLSIPGFPAEPAPADVEAGSPALFARQVDTYLAGLHYVSAYVRDRDGRLLGPAVWRIIEPNTTFNVPQVDVSALDDKARSLTPSTGASLSSGRDPLLGKARSCARWAK